MLQWIRGLEKFMFHKPGVFTDLATGLDFREKNPACFWVDQNPTLAAASYLATLLWRKDDEDSFFPKLRVRIKDNNNSPHGKFHRFFFPFSSKFSNLNFTSYVLYIYLSNCLNWKIYCDDHSSLLLCHVSHTVSLGHLWFQDAIMNWLFQYWTR